MKHRAASATDRASCLSRN